MQRGQLRTFLAVLEHGSFSAAARALGVSQSTVSFHVKALEADAGVRLLDRRGSEPRPTPAGRLLRRYAIRMLALEDEMRARLRAEETGQLGHVRVAASTIPGEYLLPPVLSAFCGAHPRVRVEVEVSDSRRAVATLLAHESDLAIIGAPVRDKRIMATPFAEDEVVLVAATRSPFASAKRLAETELARLPLIIREEGSGTRQAIARFLSVRDRTTTAAGAVLQVGSTEAVKQCALQGLGLAFISRRAIAGELETGRLTIVSVPGLPIRRRFHAARLRNITPPAAARTLLALLLQYYR